MNNLGNKVLSEVYMLQTRYQVHFEIASTQ